MKNTLNDTIAEIFNNDRGILAADESLGTIKKRFDTIGCESTEENRREYREMLFSTSGLGEYIGGAILFEETLKTDGIVEMLKEQNIVPGIKVDRGAKPFPVSPDETITEGLDGLPDRVSEYKKLGARFAKWRAVLTTMGTPSCVKANAHSLARYAAICQQQGVVPIVEPEVLMDGNHSLMAAFDETRTVLMTVFRELDAQHVYFNKIILKPNMVLPGYDLGNKVDSKKIASITINCFKDAVPASVPAIAFLSGGQPADEAINNLAEMNKIKNTPWKLTFSFGRALQGDALKLWKEDKGKAQQVLLDRAHQCSLASSKIFQCDKGSVRGKNG